MLDPKEIFALVLIQRNASVLYFIKQTVYDLNVPFQVVDLQLQTTRQHFVRFTLHFGYVQIFPAGNLAIGSWLIGASATVASS